MLSTVTFRTRRTRLLYSPAIPDQRSSCRVAVIDLRTLAGLPCALAPNMLRCWSDLLLPRRSCWPSLHTSPKLLLKLRWAGTAALRQINQNMGSGLCACRRPKMPTTDKLASSLSQGCGAVVAVTVFLKRDTQTIRRIRRSSVDRWTSKVALVVRSAHAGAVPSIGSDEKTAALPQHRDPAD